MSNTQVMHKAMTSTVKLIVLMLCTILSGIAVPFIVSILVAILSSKATLEDCVTSAGFVVFSVIGVLLSIIYLGTELEN